MDWMQYSANIGVAPSTDKPFLEWVNERLYDIGVNSVDRVYRLIDCLNRAPDDEAMWQAFNGGWSSCDAVASDALYYLSFLFSITPEPGWKYLAGDDAEFFASLPNRVTVYRGADITREAGLSWTTDIEVAQAFAKGHRGIRNPNPTIFKATVKKKKVWTAINERNESELVLSPWRLGRIKATPLAQAA